MIWIIFEKFVIWKKKNRFLEQMPKYESKDCFIRFVFCIQVVIERIKIRLVQKLGAKCIPMKWRVTLLLAVVEVHWNLVFNEFLTFQVENILLQIFGSLHACFVSARVKKFYFFENGWVHLLAVVLFFDFSFWPKCCQHFPINRHGTQFHYHEWTHFSWYRIEIYIMSLPFAVVA